MGRKRTTEAEDRLIELGKQLARARNAVGRPKSRKIWYRTQKEVAKKLGWPTSTVGKMEKGIGNPDLLKLRDLAKHYSEPLMPWLRLACGNELIDVILGAHQDEQSANNPKSAGTTPVATKDNARPKAKAAQPMKSKASVQARQKSAGEKQAQGRRLYRLAGRPTPEQFVMLYGKRGPRMTWQERADAGVPASKFQAELAERQRGGQA